MKIILVIAIALSAAACGTGYTWSPEPSSIAYGPLRSAADAIAAARLLTDLSSPIGSVGGATSGPGGRPLHGHLWIGRRE